MAGGEVNSESRSHRNIARPIRQITKAASAPSDEHNLSGVFYAL